MAIALHNLSTLGLAIATKKCWVEWIVLDCHQSHQIHIWTRAASELRTSRTKETCLANTRCLLSGNRKWYFWTAGSNLKCTSHRPNVIHRKNRHNICQEHNKVMTKQTWLDIQFQALDLTSVWKLAAKLVLWGHWYIRKTDTIQVNLCATKKLGYKFCGAVYDSHEQDI